MGSFENSRPPRKKSKFRMIDFRIVEKSVDELNSLIKTIDEELEKIKTELEELLKKGKVYLLFHEKVVQAKKEHFISLTTYKESILSVLKILKKEGNNGQIK